MTNDRHCSGRFTSVMLMAMVLLASLALAENGGILSEARIGVLLHDAAVFGSSKEDGIDINAEILLDSPSWLSWAFFPRPHIGASLHSKGDTNQFYAGVTWDVDIGWDMFAEASFGGSVHDGEKRTLNPDRKELGRRALFCGAVSLGRYMTEHVTVSLMIDHASNATLCDANEGLSNAGVRLGYKF